MVRLVMMPPIVRSVLVTTGYFALNRGVQLADLPVLRVWQAKKERKIKQYKMMYCIID